MQTYLTDTEISPVNTESRKNLNISTGDTVRVSQKIQEKGKVRFQNFEGVVIARKHGTEAGATFTVRRVGTDGISVEKVYPLFSPMIDKIEIIRRTKVRRSKLYLLREKTQKKIREILRHSEITSISSVSEQDEEKKKAQNQEEKPQQEEEVKQEKLQEKE